VITRVQLELTRQLVTTRPFFRELDSTRLDSTLSRGARIARMAEQEEQPFADAETRAEGGRLPQRQHSVRITALAEA
jgi:hypothetical protein